MVRDHSICQVSRLFESELVPALAFVNRDPLMMVLVFLNAIIVNQSNHKDKSADASNQPQTYRIVPRLV
jgi:hypothetical protein